MVLVLALPCCSSVLVGPALLVCADMSTLSLPLWSSAVPSGSESSAVSFSVSRSRGVPAQPPSSSLIRVPAPWSCTDVPSFVPSSVQLMSPGVPSSAFPSLDTSSWDVGASWSPGARRVHGGGQSSLPWGPKPCAGPPGPPHTPSPGSWSNTLSQAVTWWDLCVFLNPTETEDHSGPSARAQQGQPGAALLPCVLASPTHTHPSLGGGVESGLLLGAPCSSLKILACSKTSAITQHMVPWRDGPEIGGKDRVPMTSQCKITD